MAAPAKLLLVVYVLLVFNRAPANTACSKCPWKWREYGGYCYLMVTEKRSFQDAENHCQTLSRLGKPSHLISVASHDENAFLKSYTIDVLGPGHFALWIGLNDRASPRDFVWIDGSVASYRNFKIGEPSHGWNEDCVVLWYGEEWNDFTCTIQQPWSLCARCPTSSHVTGTVMLS